MNLNFTDNERLMLATQYEILARLDKDSADFYNQLAQQLYDGHEWLYKQSFQRLSPVMPEEDARFVLRIVGLYDDIQRSYHRLADKGGLKDSDVAFPGFDGNDSYEAGLMGFADTLAADRRYTGTLNEGRGTNSHYQAVPGYHKMLRRHQDMVSPRELTKNQIEALLGIS